jgi:hypothetical protein
MSPGRRLSPISLPPRPVQMAMTQLARWAVAENNAGTSARLAHHITARSAVSVVGVGIVRHWDGIIVEVSDCLAQSPASRVLLGLPQPYGLQWLRDEANRLIGRLVWCGIRHGFDPPAARAEGRTGGVRRTGGYRSLPFFEELVNSGCWSLEKLG